MQKLTILFWVAFQLSYIIVFAQSSDDSIIQRQSYIFEKFIAGSVLSKSGEVNHALLNYSAYDQSILFKKEDQIMVLTGLELIDTIYIADKKFIPVAAIVYELVDGKGKIQLCANYTSKLVPWDAASDHGGTEKKQFNEVNNTVSNVYANRRNKGDYSIQIIKKHWLKSYNNIYKASSVRDFLKVFKESTDPSISDFVRQNNINFEKEADLIKLVDFCNSK